MRINKLYLMFLLIFLIVILFPPCVYPYYIHYIVGYYSKQFATVLNSHNIEQYDQFFSEYTVFEVKGKKINYINARENMVAIKTFNSAYSYGHLEEGTNVFTSKKYVSSLMLPIVDYNEHNFMLEGEFILQRKYLLFFDIEKVTFYDDQEGFLEKILGFKDVGTKK